MRLLLRAACLAAATWLAFAAARAAPPLSPRTIVTAPLEFTGLRLEFSPKTLTTEPLRFTGLRLEFSPKTIPTPALVFTGQRPAEAAPTPAPATPAPAPRRPRRPAIPE